MEEIRLKTWEDFEKAVNDEYAFAESLQNENQWTYVSDILFRGHANAEWKLETTLERFCSEKDLIIEPVKWSDYHHILGSINPFFSSFTDNKFSISHDFKEDCSSRNVPPCYDFMVHVRHHGFPSPLLDWTASPYVAAFFAFENATAEKDVSIYLYREYSAQAKSGWVGEPRIESLGPYVNTHKRHYLQQCQYTICFKEKPDDNHEYSFHESVRFSADRTEQDFLKKFILPSSERKKVLKKLDLMNINAFSLFNSEETMLSTLAYREIELKNRN